MPDVHTNNPARQNRAPLRPKKTFSPLVAKGLAMESIYDKLSSRGGPQGGPRAKRLNFMSIRKVNKFNALVGEAAASPKHDASSKQAEAIKVTLDPATVSIFKSFKSFSIDHERPTTKKPSALRKQLGAKKRALTAEERGRVAENLAMRYTRDAHRLQAFAAMQADRLRLERERAAEEEEEAKRIRATLVARHHQLESHSSTIREDTSSSDSEEDDFDR